MTPKQKGILFSYLIGLASFGLFTIFLMFGIAWTDIDFWVGLLIDIYGEALLGLPASFLIALGIGGRNATVGIQKQKSLLKTSFNYSLTVNAIIWVIFTLLTIILYGAEYGYKIWLWLPQTIVFIFCTAITTFTIGLLICYVIKNQINK